MHEIVFSQEIIREIEKHLALKKKPAHILANICLSPLSHVRRETLEETFRKMVKGTELEKCHLRIHSAKVKLKCNHCHQSFSTEKPIFACPKCQQTDLIFQPVPEFYVESIEIE
jgi:hydrogenase nickel incorporation protein HypA/HybF